MKNYTKIDVVASNFRNAFFDAFQSNEIFMREDYEVLDARVLETAYQHIDKLDPNIVEFAYKAIIDGKEVKYDPEKDDFFIM